MMKAFQLEPETSVQDFVSTFVSVKTHFAAIFLATSLIFLMRHQDNFEAVS